jgi:hypothetical protein
MHHPVTSTPRLRRLKPLLAAGLFAAATLSTLGAHAAAVLLIDDDKGQNGQGAWVSALGALGHSVTLETISANGSPTHSLAGFDAVIWAIGDAAYDNLTAANVGSLTSYLDGGGRLIYGGGHSVYEENQAHAFIQTYLGLANYQYNMPMFTGSCAGATAVGSLGSLAMTCSATGAYRNMLSAFSIGLPSASSLLTMDTGFMGTQAGSTSIAALNVADGYRALTLGFDINHVAEADRTRFVGAAMDALTGSDLAQQPLLASPVSEPATLMLSAAALAGMAVSRRRRRG